MGQAVRTLSETQGALDEQETRDLWLALAAGVSAGLISERARDITRLCLATGARPLSIAVAKVKDLSLVRRVDGTSAYGWAASILKQRGVPVRTLFANLALDERVGGPIADMCARNAHWALGRCMPPGEAPLFLADPSLAREGMAELAGLEGHMGGMDVSAAIRDTVRRLQVWSVRTGAPLHAPAVRMRRTEATNMAEAGVPIGAISAALGQTGAGSALTYIELGPKFGARIDAAIGCEHAALASGFMSNPMRNLGMPSREGAPAWPGGLSISAPGSSEPTHLGGTRSAFGHLDDAGRPGASPVGRLLACPPLPRRRKD